MERGWGVNSYLVISLEDARLPDWKTALYSIICKYFVSIADELNTFTELNYSELIKEWVTYLAKDDPMASSLCILILSDNFYIFNMSTNLDRNDGSRPTITQRL